MEIKLFVPEKTGKVALDINRLNAMTGKEYQYASRGRYAVGQILRTVCCDGDAIMLPAYFCPTILEVRKLVDVKFCYYDLDLIDLNPSLESIKNIVANTNDTIKAIIIPSFYGNPANLVEIEAFCLKEGIMMIDDAAQSFGAMLGDRYVGTFGDGGMLAFSPGKATAGHMGSLFWCNNKVNVKHKRHFWYHKLSYVNYMKNRVCVYGKQSDLAKKLLNVVCQFTERYLNIQFDSMEKFEEKLLGGYLWENMALVDKRQQLFTMFVEKFNDKKEFRIIQGIRGNSHPCKIVLHFDREDVCEKCKAYLTGKNIAWFGGYKGLIRDFTTLKNTTKIINHIIELPIENNVEHMNYMIEILERFED